MTSGPSAPHKAAVERVVDGDTVRLVGIGRVRLIGIDTPELHPAPEPCARAATAFVERLLPPGTRVRYRTDAEPRDRYGRLLAYVRLPDGRELNRLLVARGYAEPLTIPPDDTYADEFESLADDARERQRGIWGPQRCGGG